MGWKEMELQYRRAALHDVSPIGAVLMLYDQLIKDLRKAQAAMRESRAEACANELKHGFLILQQLEGSLDTSTGEAFVPWLLRFYGIIRQNMLKAQIERTPELLDEQIEHILTVRSAWQEVEQRNLTGQSKPEEIPFPYGGTPSGGGSHSGWSA